MEPSVGGPASGSSSGSEARGLPWAEGSRTVKRRGCGAGGVEAEDDERGRRGRRPTGKVGGVARGRPCPSLVRQASSYGRKPCRCGRRMEPSDGGLRSGSSSGSEANGLPGAEGSRTVRRRGCSAGGGEAARGGGPCTHARWFAESGRRPRAAPAEEKRSPLLKHLQGTNR